MKTLAILASLFAAVSAQQASIYAPTSGETFAAGQDITVTVVETNSLTNIEQLGIGIAIQNCDPNDCSAAEEGYLGRLMYSGPFNPQLSNGFPPAGGSFQNFTVTIPDFLSSGPAVLSVAHAALLGASTFFIAEVLNVTVNIA